MIIEIILVLSAYLLGSLASAVIVCRVMNLPDPRSSGSGNPGATNVLRMGGKKAAILTLFFDVLKGVIAVLIASFLTNNVSTLALVCLAVFLGHLYPLFFGFRGGKGVATAFGALVALNWMVGLAVLATWLGMAIVFRYSSLSALAAALLAPAYLFWFTQTWQFIIMGAVMSSLLVWRHRSNIHKLLTGQEDKIGAKKTASPPTA